MSEEDEEHYGKNNICRFCEKMNLIKLEVLVT